MPWQTRLYIYTALIYLFVALLVGGYIQINQGLKLNMPLWGLLPVFYHLLTVGWLTQLIGGVALWMFPLLSREQPRGNERLSWFAYAALNVGILLRVIGEPFLVWSGHGGWMLVFAALFQILGGWALVGALWPRVKGRLRRDQR